MKKYLVLTILVLFQISKSESQITRKQLDNLLIEVMAKEHIPGLAYAVIKDGKVVYKNTLGKASVPFNVPVNNETVFQLASCSKIYTALLLGKLFDLGILKPETTIKDLVDNIPSGWENITIMHLVAHQSGIKIADFSKATTSGEAFELAKSMPFEFQTGEKSEYMSSDYWILLYLIEKVTQLKYYDALKKYVLEPLKLNHSFVNNPKFGMFTDLDILPNQAQEYHWFKNENTLRINQMWFKETDYAAGGIYSSIDDMTKIAVALDNKDFLSESSYDLIANPLKLKNGQNGSYGLALVVRDYENHKIIEHSGGPALADFVKFEKERYTFVVLTNNRGVYPYLSKLIASYFIDGLSKAGSPEGWE